MASEQRKIINKLTIGLATSGFLLLIILGGLAWLGFSYQDRILPSISIGSVEVGGKTESDVRQIIKAEYAQVIEPGVTVSYDRGQGNEEMVVKVPVQFDVETATQTVLRYGKEGNYLNRGLQIILSHFGQADLPLVGLSVTPSDIESAIRNALSPFETPARSAELKVVSLDPFKYTISSSTPGVVFNYTGIGSQVLQNWNQLTSAHVHILSQIDYPAISESDVATVATSTAAILGNPINLTYFDAHTKRYYEWPIKRQQIADWIEITKDANQKIQLTLATDPLTTFISSTIKSVVDVPPLDAVFKINTSTTKVIQFVGSRPGVTVDVPSTQRGVEFVFAKRQNYEVATSTPLIVSKVEPNIKTEDTNDLGIKEILGTGVSNYSGSPHNRILNIRNAVMNKLNGTLVAPGVEFSLVKTLGPYTLESGYLPELVIKGDRITPEVAGGLCQVGTTMFRSTMNSGLPVTARTNHGLVVSYYNDPANGLPGTDATIYDPWPDFRFKNDTGHYVLITTSMNTNTGELAFSIWGTNDGRKAYYTPPRVLSRTPAGEFQTIETNDLPPGKKECQGAHPGAVASFNYIRELPGKDREVREFRSVYRAVSGRCFVGHDPNKPTCIEGQPNCTPAPGSNVEPTPQPVPSPIPGSDALPPAPISE